MAKAKRSEGDKTKIMDEARKRFTKCQAWESSARTNFERDLKFAEGDSVNNYQWSDGAQQLRQGRPMLTINRVRQHNLDILNDARQSKVSIRIKPLRDGADFESAQTLEGVIKHIEYISKADSAYQHALSFAVRAGWGYCRLATDYADDNTFDQEIFIRRVKDPRTIYLDPDIAEFDGSDAMYGFVFTDMPKDEFDRTYPKYKDRARNSELAPDETWCMDDKVRVAEYFRRVPNDDELIAYTDPETGQQTQAKASEIEKELYKSIIDQPATKVRDISLMEVEHFMIIGDEIAEEKEWPGSYIPLIRCIGEETVIDGIMDRKGHTRALLDSQRMLNYNASIMVEYGALQSKIPWTGPAAAIEGFERDWEEANTSNKAFLAYNHVDDDGNPIPKPERVAPPVPMPVAAQGMKDAIDQMYLASGQNQADFGQPGNERSGVAIENRQRQGDNATFHYLDHQASMIQNIGRQILDLIPKVYDTQRLLKMRDDSGMESDVQIDPDSPVPVQTQKTGQDQQAVVLNPKLGVHDVVAEVGKAYATQREEAFAAGIQILTQNKELTPIIGDIVMRSADFPLSQEMAERMRRMVPAQALQDGPPPEVAALNAQLQKAQEIIKEMSDKAASKMADHVNDQDQNSIRAYDAQTKRIAAVSDYLPLDQAGLIELLRNVITEAIHTSSDAPFEQANNGSPYIPTQEDQQAPPPPQPGMGGPAPTPQPGGLPGGPSQVSEPMGAPASPGAPMPAQG